MVVRQNFVVFDLGYRLYRPVYRLDLVSAFDFRFENFSHEFAAANAEFVIKGI
jgi:hypothetical protein